MLHILRIKRQAPTNVNNQNYLVGVNRNVIDHLRFLSGQSKTLFRSTTEFDFSCWRFLLVDKMMLKVASRAGNGGFNGYILKTVMSSSVLRRFVKFIMELHNFLKEPWSSLSSTCQFYLWTFEFMKWIETQFLVAFACFIDTSISILNLSYPNSCLGLLFIGMRRKIR